jgi:thiamine-phosphate pyrophosphorylase
MNLLRLLDANANRAREALRVIEDFARFVLNDEKTCGELKNIRHGLTESLRDILPDAIFHRDTRGDVGTTIKTESEGIRTDVSHVVTAAGKRLGEALRAIEEFLKIDRPTASRTVESLRYRFYSVEQSIAFTLRPAVSRMADVRLCVLITESCCKHPWFETAELALAGGADCLQLREKNLESGELLYRAEKLVALCRAKQAVSIINDRPDIAILSGADGTHVGQGDLPPRQVRRLVGNQMMVGVSTHNIAQAKQAVLDGADYIGVGPIFKSGTKPRDLIPGLDFAKEVSGSISIPTLAIAGITDQNVDDVLAAGIRAIAVTASVTASADPRLAASRLKEKLAAACA